MFGYITADLSSLTDEQKSRYRGCYCGLCHVLGSEYGTVHRLTLNYDLTFLALILSSLYESQETEATARCLAHPLTTHHFWMTDATKYAAAMNIALSYHKMIDDWNDDHNILSRTMAAILSSDLQQIRTTYRRQWDAIQNCIDALSVLELQNCQEPDMGANLFGTLMGELFVWKDDRWSSSLRTMGEALGRFIYLMDAVLDLPSDIKKGNYNALSSRYGLDYSKESYYPILEMLIGECCSAFEQLPIIQDLEILRNILYSGVWTRYHNHTIKEQ